MLDISCISVIVSLTKEHLIKDGTDIIAYLLLILFLVLVGPLLSIWAANTLFPQLNIPYTMETWAASAILTTIFRIKS
jgi:hypothetical protein